MQDKLIVKYIKKCNQKGMEMLIDSYNGLLTSVIRKHINPLLIYEEECISDVLFLIWENIEVFDSKQNTFKNWICAIAKYKAIDYKRKYISKLNLDIDNNIFYIDENLARVEIEEEINEILNFLNDKDKELFTRYYLDGYKLEEIAIDTKTNVSNLHSRLSRGRKKIRKIFSK
ncbi:sigma-70 family RNA polymerase sigma factor [Clostridium sp. CCUG 7971]|uniref:sigma-70 family RNA polymerase sigma factor n=1 Tax=Clostridium sp. CCUG 7971 TaxID=2811414 RepID=UPI001ABBDA49|nr:sigma-70 family RNA polymerase sigma factor [Clostridium sp. CCUG 7971]MBO3445389.1 sigma-70 family RNA polymerase sigma factor [Clostridium sp. CCUG 7971]